MDLNSTTMPLAIIPFSPLLGALVAYLVGKAKPQLSGWIATLASAIAFAATLKFFLGLGHNDIYTQQLFQWFGVAGQGFGLDINFALRFDHLSAVMCMIVTGIGTLIHLYSIGYMAEDSCQPRFFSYLNLFMFSMLLLVLGANLLVLFVGWEGVGLCSYLLIGFWFKNLPFAAAGRKAFVVNRIGDAGFLVGIFLLLMHFGTTEFGSLQTAVAANPDNGWLYTVVAICFFIGATGKSAQIPLFVWLPDAMAGPTPVSALIHAATMVTAGVYMLARVHFLFDLAPFALAVVCLIALLTAFIAGSTALVQNDIKKVLAYSTVSQLGFMFVAASVGAYAIAIFHVVTHAFFKACLFLGAGSVIHGCHHEQDMRQMGGLRKYMPITFATYTIATLAIAGIWPFAGYHSKHGILAALQANTNPYIMQYSGLLVFILTLTAFLTAFYMTRSVCMTFFGEYRGHAHPHESPWQMTVPLIVLALLSLGGGIALQESLPHFLAHAGVPAGIEHHSETFIESILHSWVGIAGVLLGFFIYVWRAGIARQFYDAAPAVHNILSSKYYFDEVYNALIVRPLERLADSLWREVDQTIIDGTVNGTASVVDANGEILSKIQTGQIRQYAMLIFGATVLLLLFYVVL